MTYLMQLYLRGVAMFIMFRHFVSPLSAGSRFSAPGISKARCLSRSALSTSALSSSLEGLSEETPARASANHLIFDTNLLANSPDIVRSHLAARHAPVHLLDDVLKISQLRHRRLDASHRGDKARNERKVISQKIGQLLKISKAERGGSGSGGEAVEDSQLVDLKSQVTVCSDISTGADEEVAEMDRQLDEIISYFPNLLHDSVPNGSGDSDNVELKRWGDDRRQVYSDQTEADRHWHDTVATSLGGLRAEAAVAMSGGRFSVLCGPLSRLERALGQYCMDFHSARGYEEVSVPLIVSQSTLYNTGQMPKFREDLFSVGHTVHGGEQTYLIPTAEVPVTNIYRGALLSQTDLPIRHVCLSPCFRAEAGSHGRDVRGLLRQHQFHKVELVKVVSPESSMDEHQRTVEDVEALLQSLGLPYRTVLLCSADTGFSARLCVDVEVWLPGQQQFREISSISNCFEFQARRMGLRYKPSPAPPTAAPAGQSHPKKLLNVIPHTINGSGVAIGRCLVAILENYLQADGSVLVPEVLRKYMGDVTVLKPIKARK